MRNIAFLALVVLVAGPSCTYRPRSVHLPDRPVFGPRAGLTPGSTAPRPQPSQCTEVGRTRCNAVECPGFNYDYVRVQCTGEGVKAYCQANGGCKAAETK